MTTTGGVQKNETFSLSRIDSISLSIQKHKGSKNKKPILHFVLHLSTKPTTVKHALVKKSPDLRRCQKFPPARHPNFQFIHTAQSRDRPWATHKAELTSTKNSCTVFHISKWAEF